MLTFIIGGMTGVMLAVPPADFVLHNSLFLIAHFHNVIIGGVLFGLFAGINYWFPKMFGYKLDRKWGMASFWLWSIGFWVAFTPPYILGFMGVHPPHEPLRGSVDAVAVPDLAGRHPDDRRRYRLPADAVRRHRSATASSCAT